MAQTAAWTSRYDTRKVHIMTDNSKSVLGKAAEKNASNTASKSDNGKTQVSANLEIRQLASAITRARKASKDWKRYEDEAKERLLDIIDGDTNTEMVTDAGDVVATVSESKPSVRMDWKAFKTDHPDLDYSKYETVAEKGTVTVRTSWIEQTPDDK